MKILNFFKRAVKAVLVTFPDWVTEKIGIDKQTHIFLSLYLLWYFKIFDFGWGVLGAIVVTGVSFLREKFSPNPDYNDTKVTAIACFLDLFIFALLSIYFEVRWGIVLHV